MSELPPNSDQPDDIDDLYRRASAQDPSRPSESVRRAVLEHAARLARERAAEEAVAATGSGADRLGADRLVAQGSHAEPLTEDVPGTLGAARTAANQSWRRPAIFGTLAAACLAGLLIVPQFLPPHAPRAPAAAALSNSEAGPSRVDAVQTPGAEASVADSPLLAAQTPAAPLPEAPPVAQRQSMERSRNSQPAEKAARRLAQDYVSDSARDNASSDAQAKLESLADARGDSRVYGGAAPGNAPAEAPAPARPPAAAENAAGAAATSPLVARTESATRPGMLAQPGMLVSPAPNAAGRIVAGRAADPAAELRRAAQIGDVPGVRLQLDRQTDVDARDADGRTALMLATLHGQMRAVQALLSAGADPNAADAGGVTPLQAAVNGNQPAIAEALRRAGAR